MSEQPQETDAEILKALSETEKDRAWVSKNYDQLRSDYQGKVFAVKGGQIIAASGNITELVEEVKKKGEDSAVLLMESIPPKGIVFIL